MEELLASIRKAINDDLGDSHPAPRPAPHVASGREAQARPLLPAVANEIEELRSRINRNRTTEGVARTSAPPSQPVTPMRPVFAGILGGDSERTRRAPEFSNPPAFRPSYADADTRPSDHRSERPSIRDVDHGFPVQMPHPLETPVMSPDSSAAASVAFHRLADSLLSRATGDRSIEDMTRELLRGMVKQWLDDNLPELVERLVREEIERVARRTR